MTNFLLCFGVTSKYSVRTEVFSIGGAATVKTLFIQHIHFIMYH